MRDISGIELNVVVTELRGSIESLHFKSFYDFEDDSFLLALSRSGKETDVYIRLNKTVNVTASKEQAAAPSQFAQNVRKALAGMQVEGVSQNSFDRIVTIAMRGRETSKKLVIELFGKGNLFIVRNDGLTELAYRNVSFRDRNVRKNMLYGLPKTESIGPGEADPETIGRVIGEVSVLDERLISALNRRIGIGPIYLEDILARAGLDPKGRANTQGIEKGRLAEEMLAFFERAKKPEPRIYVKDGEYIDYSLLPLRKYEEMKGEGVTELAFGGGTPLNGLLDELYRKDRSTGVDLKKAREIAELASSVAKLRDQMKREQEVSVTYVEIGNEIFGHMHEINELIEHLKRTKAKSAEGMPVFGRVRAKDVDPKTKTVRIELEG
jgi:predicted ribosome quality control (RQC) complex YloA/Tae2 family protein